MFSWNQKLNEKELYSNVKLFQLDHQCYEILDNKVVLIIILGSLFQLDHQCYENFGQTNLS